MNRMQTYCRGVKKIGGRKVIHRQSREIVISVHSSKKKVVVSCNGINVIQKNMCL
jgi:hypothetical protein